MKINGSRVVEEVSRSLRDYGLTLPQQYPIIIEEFTEGAVSQTTGMQDSALMAERHIDFATRACIDPKVPWEYGHSLPPEHPRMILAREMKERGGPKAREDLNRIIFDCRKRDLQSEAYGQFVKGLDFSTTRAVTDQLSELIDFEPEKEPHASRYYYSRRLGERCGSEIRAALFGPPERIMKSKADEIQVSCLIYSELGLSKAIDFHITVPLGGIHYYIIAGMGGDASDFEALRRLALVSQFLAYGHFFSAMVQKTA